MGLRENILFDWKTRGQGFFFVPWFFAVRVVRKLQFPNKLG
jgi:hypothetical protein